jgi:hypothetical protein
MVERARLEPREAGLTPVTDGWFVVNVRQAPWWTNDALGPPETEHVFVGAGDGPCAILMTGARNGWPDHTGIVNALGGRAAARRRGRERDDERGGGLRPLPPPAPRTARELGRTPLGVSQGRD